MTSNGLPFSLRILQIIAWEPRPVGNAEWTLIASVSKSSTSMYYPGYMMRHWILLNLARLWDIRVCCLLLYIITWAAWAVTSTSGAAYNQVLSVEIRRSRVPYFACPLLFWAKQLVWGVTGLKPWQEHGLPLLQSCSWNWLVSHPAVLVSVQFWYLASAICGRDYLAGSETSEW